MFLKNFLRPNLLSPGTPAPPFRLLDQEGITISLEEVLKSADIQNLVLVFFATDNESADHKLLKDYAQMYEAFKSQGVEVLALSAVNWETLHHLTKALTLPYRVLFDPCTRIAKQYGAVRLPGFITGQAVFVVDKTGMIFFTGKGSMAASEILKFFESR